MKKRSLQLCELRVEGPISQSEIELTSVHGSSGAKPGSQLDTRLVRVKISI